MGPHIRKHGLTPQEYYDKYLKTEGEDICHLNGCSNKTNFRGYQYGYAAHCCRSHQVANGWSYDETGKRHEAQREIGRMVMTEQNKVQWNDPEFRKRHSERMSKVMTELNSRFWADENYWLAKSEQAKDRMKSPEYKAYLDYQRFVKNYDEAIFYLIKRSDTFKIGIAHVQGSDKMGRMWSKLSKYAERDSSYWVFYSKGTTAADLEYLIKTNYQSVKGTFEIFDNSLFDEIYELVESKLELIRKP